MSQINATSSILRVRKMGDDDDGDDREDDDEKDD
jgi:hypothetical protein